MILRDYQTAAVDAVLRDFESVGSTLVEMATGTGKTPTAGQLAKHFVEQGGRVIFLSHREEIIIKSRSTFEKDFGLECELELGQFRASEMYPAPVLMASVQTMTSGRKNARRMHKFSPFNYDFIICDEAHHFVAPMFREPVDYFRSGNPNTKVLYLTATAQRSDKQAMGQVCESVAFRYPAIQAIKDGWLVPVEQQLIDIQSLDFSSVRTTAGDLNAGDLAAVMEAERNLYGICDATIREIGNRKAIMFVVTVKQAHMSADILNRYKAGIAVCVSGKTPKEDRRRIMRDFHDGSGGLQILVNVDVASEGVDIPDASLLIGARPTKSPLWYQQSMGRTMRPLPGCVDNVANDSGSRRAAIAASAKPVATVMDFVGNAGRHKLVHAVDVLGGKISDKVRELAERELRKTGAPMEVDKLVEEAERMEREEAERLERARRAKLIAKAVYTVRLIDPFDAFDVVRPPDRAWDRSKQLSEKQRALLAKQGIDPDRLTFTESKAVIQELFHRWTTGLASLRQCALLKRHGYETKGMSREKAGELITELKANGWQRPVVQTV